MADERIHVPVLLDRALELLAPRPGGLYIDATIGGGGHARAIAAAAGPNGRVLGLERDPAVAEVLARALADSPAAGPIEVVRTDFRRLGEVAAEQGMDDVDGVLFDLGINSYHVDRSGRGFSFAADEPLDMRFDPASDGPTAAELLRDADARELTHWFGTFGEERFASRIARTIAARRRERPVETSAALLDAIERSLPPATRWRAARHAARVFQGLRIAVNDELDAIREALPQALALLGPGGRLVVISFHSLEDRIAKHFIRDAVGRGEMNALTRKPIRPGEDEVAANPRAASAKLRAAERLPPQ